MNGYSEIDAIYFSIGKKTSFAKYLDAQDDCGNPRRNLVKGTYIGDPPYKKITSSLSSEHRQYHAAEHIVYNNFMNKIKKLAPDTPLNVFQNFVPKFEELNKEKSFSFFCGTSFFMGSTSLVLLSALPNLLDYKNEEPVFMILWLIFSLVISILFCKVIQKHYYLKTPQHKHINLAIEALKEVLKDEPKLC